MYNTSNITAARDYYQISLAVNQLSNGWLFSLFMLILFVVILAVFRNTASLKALFTADSFICLFISILLFFNGLVGYIILTVFSILFLASLLIYLFTE